ncbi:MAG: GDSL-type esterase/lipase family protein [Gemella sp.]|nr:GDSL-type esterase/lipase family protein [Gemella sp.]
MKPICLIPARSGSKGLKDKNLLFLDSKPMIFHTIDAAIESGVFAKEDIYVSTDSKLYADICKSRGISVLDRPSHLATDTATSYEVNEYFLKDFSERQVFVLLQPTSPLRSGKQIEEALKSYLESESDHLVSYTKVGKSPDLYTSLDADGYIQDNFGVDKGYRRQDKKDYYVPNGAIFISRKDKYLRDKSYFTEKTKAYIMDKHTSLDIDDEVDFKNAIASKYFDYKTREEKWKPDFAGKYKLLANKIENKLIVGDSRLTTFSATGYTNISIPGVTMHTFMENKDLFLSNSIGHIVLALGVNDFTAGYSIESLKKQFLDLVEICKQDNIKLSIASIALTIFRLIDNNDLCQFNEWLKELAQDNNIDFVEVNEVLAQDNRLRFDLTTDGLHFSKEGQELYHTQIEKLIYKEG